MSKKSHDSEPNLKGTLISVFAVGIIIVVMWFAVYGLYVAR
ncbi:cytochrome C oxidase subunit II [Lederbergia citrea]|uniref:Cytochrome C oxidase subunit II n=1 Tax=Lederbergia citrea TaxID=2833581 RepID=A0A942Z6A7_9BACI|nr:cytochrome C oxidase subunit II [Lederbergia citrea]MBS4178697.1 cytochrome C oxidase subunit II [Lederbergia citrea]MBS4205389.1 cytochrome C oxidase subunit II [Lederbergia citrea]MBS4224295.1 cytochrome C oxidase subunit II [Lederbergia citrea]